MRRYLAIAIFLISLAAPALAADPPTCRNARQCADILTRHAPDSFDYSVLAEEFSRLGGKGETALARLAADPETASRAFDLAARPAAHPRLRERLLAGWPAPDPALHIDLARDHASPVFRGRAIATLHSPDPALRAASVEALATQSPQLSPTEATVALPALARSAETAPSVPVIALLANMPGERGAPHIVRALRANDPDVIVTAYLALEALNAPRARADLEAAFRAAPPAYAPAWTKALEQIGMRSQTFDTIGMGHRWLDDDTLPAHLRAVALHSALLYPAGEKGSIGLSHAPLLPDLMTLPVSARLADTAASHPLFGNAKSLERLAPVFDDTPTRQRFVRSLGKARTVAARPLLKEMFQATSDFRLQLSVIDALGSISPDDADWIKGAARGHPLHSVRLAAGLDTPRSVSCVASDNPVRREPERLPYFESGRHADGRRPGRWELIDAQPIPGGWLAAYEGGLIRYTSNDAAAPLELAGRPLAIFPDTSPATGQRAPRHWILTDDGEVTRLVRFDVQSGLATPVTLPTGVRLVTSPEGAPRPWTLSFPGSQQPDLILSRDGRITPLCGPPS